MNISELLNVNPLLADRVRLAIMAYLVGSDIAIDFNTLLHDLELTKGNLSTHIRKLEEANLITISKEFVGKKPRTTYFCTDYGRSEISAYLEVVESVLKRSL